MWIDGNLPKYYTISDYGTFNKNENSFRHKKAGTKKVPANNTANLG